MGIYCFNEPGQREDVIFRLGEKTFHREGSDMFSMPRNCTVLNANN